MANENNELRTRRRYSKRRQMDKILNILIVVVVVLIVLTTYFILSDHGEEVAREEGNVEEHQYSHDEKMLSDEEKKDDKKERKSASKSGTLAEKYENIEGFEREETEEEVQTEEAEPKKHSPKASKEKERIKKSDEIKVTPSDDADVEQVIVNNNWEVTPTSQTGPHTSTFQKGDLDYEEKLVTIRNAVELSEDEIIYKSVRNDGTGQGAIAVVTSKETGKNYRVHIKWVDQSGWIPTKVEVLK